MKKGEMVTRIDPYAIYSAEEVEALLKGRAFLPTLRRFGLRGLADGYYGQNIHDALVSWLAHRGKVNAERETDEEMVFPRLHDGFEVIEFNALSDSAEVFPLSKNEVKP